MCTQTNIAGACQDITTVEKRISAVEQIIEDLLKNHDIKLNGNGHGKKRKTTGLAPGGKDWPTYWRERKALQKTKMKGNTDGFTEFGRIVYEGATAKGIDTFWKLSKKSLYKRNVMKRVMEGKSFMASRNALALMQFLSDEILAHGWSFQKFMSVATGTGRQKKPAKKKNKK